jgi:hypothetical protein
MAQDKEDQTQPIIPEVIDNDAYTRWGWNPETQTIEMPAEVMAEAMARLPFDFAQLNGLAEELLAKGWVVLELQKPGPLSNLEKSILFHELSHLTRKYVSYQQVAEARIIILAQPFSPELFPEWLR